MSFNVELVSYKQAFRYWKDFEYYKLTKYTGLCKVILIGDE